jgi:hypothetical protein
VELFPLLQLEVLRKLGKHLLKRQGKLLPRLVVAHPNHPHHQQKRLPHLRRINLKFFENKKNYKYFSQKEGFFI